MKQIEITVSEKVARLVDENTIIICDNSDYVANFNFDSEWDAYDVKTARFIWNGKYEEKVFTGTQCAIPVINDTSCVYIGVYAGNLSTTTGVRVPTQKSILGGSPVHSEPEPDVYNQILALLESMEGVSEEEIAAAVKKYLTENPLDGVTSVNNKTGAVTLGASDVGAIPVPETAAVGQTIVVKSVDESGKPTEWQAADMPSGGTVDIPTELPNPFALTFTGAVTATYDGSKAVTVEIPSGGGSGTAKTQKLIDVTLDEATASISVTLEHNFHRLFWVWDSGSNGVARIVNADGNAISSALTVLLDTTTVSWNALKVGMIATDTSTYKSDALIMEWTDDASTYIRSNRYSVQSGTSSSVYNTFGGYSAMAGTLGTAEALTPVAGRTVNIVASSGYFAPTTKIKLVGEYYE